MTALNNAFHPAGTSSHKTPELVAYDVIEGSASILRLVESLTKRLLGTYTQVRGDEEARSMAPSIAAKLSPAQLAAKEVCFLLLFVLTAHTATSQLTFQVLTEDPVGTCKMSELANDLTAHHVAALARRSMNKSFYTCCAHCTGQVHVI